MSKMTVGDFEHQNRKMKIECLPKLNHIRSQYASFRRCYMDLNFEISKRWYTEKKEEFER